MLAPRDNKEVTVLKGLFVPAFDDFDAILAFASDLQSQSLVALDFSRVGFALPTGMLLLASIIARANVEGRIAHSLGWTAYDYAANMGFYDACGLNVPKHNAPGSATYYPVTRFSVEDLQKGAQKQGLPVGAHVNMLVGRLAYLITRETSGDLFYTVRYCLREMLRNVAEHSHSDQLLVMGQYWKERREIELAVLDQGIGLRRALVENPRFAELNSDRNAIRLALLPSTSGKKIYDPSTGQREVDEDGEWGNSGFGLYITSQIARRAGRFLIASGDSRLELSGNAQKPGGFSLPGTLVSMKFNVDRLGRLEPSLKLISDRGEAIAKRFLTAGADVLASAASRLIMDTET